MKKRFASFILAAMMAVSFGAVTASAEDQSDSNSIQNIYYNEVEFEDDSFLFTLTEVSDPLASYCTDSIIHNSKTVTQVRVTPTTEEYYNKMYSDLMASPLSGSDSKTRYRVDTSSTYNMYLTVTFDIEDFQRNGEYATGARVSSVDGGYYGYGGSGSPIGSGVSVTAQNVSVGNVGKGADMLAGNWINQTKTYNPSASREDWSYSLPSTWNYVNIADNNTIGATYTTTAKRGSSTWDSSLQVNY